jgi:flavodoxin I
MKTLVAYDSLYGNTKTIALAIAGSLPGEVRVLHAGDVSREDLAGVDLLIVGSPTHGALPTQPALALIERIGPPPNVGARAAAFDTRLAWGFLERWGGFAALRLADKLVEKGWTLAGAPGGFFVRGLRRGPLKKGEVERAIAWAQGLMR